MSAPILNGVTIYPSDIERRKSKVGKPQVTANGVRTFIHRTNAGGSPLFQNQWDLTFNSITNARRGTLLSLANVATAMSWVDENGDVFTAHTEEDAFSYSVAFIAGDGSIYYDVKLSLFEG